MCGKYLNFDERESLPHFVETGGSSIASKDYSLSQNDDQIDHASNVAAAVSNQDDDAAVASVQDDSVARPSTPENTTAEPPTCEDTIN